MRLCLGIPCWNEEQQLPALAAAVRALDPAPDHCVLVDDGSTDGTAAAARALGLVVHSLPRNLGLAAARNRLVDLAEAAGCEVLAFLDADARPAPDHLLRVRDAFADPTLAGFGGANEEGPPRGRADLFRARFWQQRLGERVIDPAPMLVGANAAYRVAALRSVGGFDERFRTNGEDVDIGRRLRLHGHRLRYDPTCVVHHERHDDLRSLVQMVHRHTYFGLLAARRTPLLEPTPMQLSRGLLLRALSAPLAGLLKRGDPIEAAISTLAGASALLGHVRAWREDPR